MVAPTADWLGPHSLFYQRMIEDLAARPPEPPLHDYLSKDIPHFFTRTMGRPEGYVLAPPNPTNSGQRGISPGPFADGDEVLYWDGVNLTNRVFDSETYWMWDYRKLARLIVDMAAKIAVPNPTIIDLGAGTCTLALALREAGCTFRFINLDIFERALKVGRAMTESLGVSDVLFRRIDISAALANEDERRQLRDDLLTTAGGPIIVVSRKALHPFYAPKEAEALFDFVLRDIDAVAGIHLEMCGHLTPSFSVIRAAFPGNIPTDNLIGNKLKGDLGDLFSYLSKLPKLTVQHRREIWPHYLTRQFPSLLSWSRS